jgi:hypothetical protein
MRHWPQGDAAGEAAFPVSFETFRDFGFAVAI